jgi:GT2 family glycosyltransferase
LESLLTDVADRAEVIVVDQSDDRATEDIMRGYTRSPRVRYVCCAARKGAGASRNLGASLALGEVLLFVDDDCRVDPGWFTAWVSFMASSDAVGVAFGTVLPGVATPPGGWLPVFEPATSALISSRRVFWRSGEAVGMGANMAMRHAAWLALGGFDEVLGPGAPLRSAEDIDITYRALSAGWQIAQAFRPRVRHVGVRTGRDASHLAEVYLFGAGAMYMKHIRCGDAYAALLLGHVCAHNAVRVLGNLAGRRRPSGARSLPWYVIGACRSMRYPIHRSTRRYNPGAALLTTERTLGTSALS